ncbi:peptidoglycan-binding protein [Luteibacter aegosomaticola]|uniref:XVIPCD domain-containing protein n=1 Tax=Luteibacter aegosomaticola TaxID=2911538 RepID=UPI001FFAF4FC|nr:XVIPCD domain-containing protein [Luteibacter aegosomaticola]UPG88930.1 peptidoglycan-binding protein [Luteibacter aegosomaticola]
MAGENPLDTRFDAARQELVDAAHTAGVDPGVLVKIAGFESGYNPHARPIAGHKHADLNTVTQFDGTKAMSSAYGYGQFLNKTWANMVREHGEKYGIEHAADLTDAQTNTAAMRNNTRLQAGMLAEFTKENAAVGAKLGGADAAANVYAMHNLGGGDGPKFLKAMAEHPNARVDSVLSSTVIERNSALYGDGSISLAAAYKNMGTQMERFTPYANQVSGQTQGQPAPTPQHAPATPHTTPHHDAPRHAAPDAHGRTMKEGMHGEDVRALQRQLGSLGYTDAHGHPLKADASFGPATKAALEAYQAKNHLEADGIAGPATLGRLNTPGNKPLISDPNHAGHAIYKQALEGMQKVDAAQGRTSDHITANVAGALAAESQAQGLNRIDSVALNTDATRCWAVQGQTNDPFKQLASVDLNQAVNTSLMQSTAAWEKASQHQQAAQGQQQDLAQTQTQNQAQAQAPSMQR